MGLITCYVPQNMIILCNMTMCNTLYYVSIIDLPLILCRMRRREVWYRFCFHYTKSEGMQLWETDKIR
jgi:hypothetical protein